jgi:hypothetical protein
VVKVSISAHHIHQNEHCHRCSLHLRMCRMRMC